MENPDDGTERNHMENPDDCTERHHMENPDDGRDAFRTSRSFRKEKWPLAMVHHAHCEIKISRSLSLPKGRRTFAVLA